ncbi:hypothetical protein Hanom_Chr01g00074501 [Helianthus anomalus]
MKNRYKVEVEFSDLGFLPVVHPVPPSRRSFGIVLIHLEIFETLFPSLKLPDGSHNFPSESVIIDKNFKQKQN